MPRAPSVAAFFAKQDGAWEPAGSPSAAVAPSGRALRVSPKQNKLEAFLGNPQAGSWIPSPAQKTKHSPPTSQISLPPDVLERIASVRPFASDKPLRAGSLRRAATISYMPAGLHRMATTLCARLYGMTVTLCLLPAATLQMLFDDFEAALRVATAAETPVAVLDPNLYPTKGSLVQLVEDDGTRFDDPGVLRGGARGRVIADTSTNPGDPAPFAVQTEAAYRAGADGINAGSDLNMTWYGHGRLTCLNEGYPAENPQGRVPEVDNSSLLRPLAALSKFMTVNSAFRHHFRPYYIAAMFR